MVQFGLDIFCFSYYIISKEKIMFNFFKGLDRIAEVKELESNIEKLTKENGELHRVIGEMKSDYAKQQKKQLEEMAQCDFEIDFEGVSVVTVERILDQNGKEKTLFGRKMDSGNIECNFYFYCSRERHNEIVKKFREYMSSKKGSNDGKNATVLPTQ